MQIKFERKTQFSFTFIHDIFLMFKVESQSQESHATNVAAFTNEDTNQTPQRKKVDSVQKRKCANDNSAIDEKLFRSALETLQKPPDDYERFGQYVAMELRTLTTNYYKKN